MDHEIVGGPLKLANGVALPLSKAGRAGDFVFLAGQLALDESGALIEGDIAAQTRQCIANIQSILSEADCDLSNVVKATVWLVDRKDFGGFNKAYSEFFAESPPTRSAVCSELMLPGALVEIEVMAYRKKNADGS